MPFLLAPLAAVLIATTTGEATPPTLCNANEQTIISGSVQDDFGLDVAVCVSSKAGGQIADEKATATHLTIRWSGEGGSDEVSCTPDACEGIIEYSRYTSSHLTILQIAWIKDGNVQRLYQSLCRPHLDGPVMTSTTHSWVAARSSLEAAQHFSVRTNAQPLALMALEKIVEAKPAHMPLLSKAPAGRSQ
ncbi:MAG: hypothetical protein AAFQ27_04075 [Pseudomonadota bacterium]